MPPAAAGKPAAATTPPTTTTMTDKVAAPAATPVVELVGKERTAIFPKEKAAAFIQAVFFVPPDGITDYWTPTAADLAGIETGLGKYVEAQGRSHRGDWALYERQVAGVVVGGEKFLLLSYFTKDKTLQEKASAARDPKYDADDWTKVPFWINDGGDVYFRVEYDPRKKQFIWYEKNGDA